MKKIILGLALCLMFVGVANADEPTCDIERADNYGEVGACIITGCTNTRALNYDCEATISNPSMCEFAGGNGMIPSIADGTDPCAGFGVGQTTFRQSCEASFPQIYNPVEEEEPVLGAMTQEDIMRTIIELQVQVLNLLHQLMALVG